MSHSQQPPPAGGLGSQGYNSGPAYASPTTKPGWSTGTIIAIVAASVVGGMMLIIGILAVLGVYGTRKYIAAAKRAEAHANVSRMAMSAAAAYERSPDDPRPGFVADPDPDPAADPDPEADDQTDNAPTTPGTRSGVMHVLCPSALAPVPRSTAQIRGVKYLSAPSEWTTDPGFSCLGFEMNTPQYYQYNYASTPDAFTATAKGDLNGDGILSTSDLTGVVKDGVVIVAPSMNEIAPEE